MDWLEFLKYFVIWGLLLFFVLKPVLRYLIKRMTLASVGAELNAQCGDQQLVNEVCFSSFGMEHILRVKSDFPRNSMRSAMITASLLSEVANSEQFSKETRVSCNDYLGDRLKRLYANPLAANRLFRAEAVNQLREKYDQASRALS